MCQWGQGGVPRRRATLSLALCLSLTGRVTLIVSLTAGRAGRRAPRARDADGGMALPADDRTGQ
jgi:hypothetical protein